MNCLLDHGRMRAEQTLRTQMLKLTWPSLRSGPRS
jgi:hypothetical protein